MAEIPEGGTPPPERSQELRWIDGGELAADSLQVTAQRISVTGPPFRVQFGLLPGETWPEMGLVIVLGETPAFKITTTERRLHALFLELAEATES